jgi:hypothetical protein
MAGSDGVRLSKILDVREYDLGYELSVHGFSCADNGYGTHPAESSTSIGLAKAARPGHQERSSPRGNSSTLAAACQRGAFRGPHCLA